MASYEEGHPNQQAHSKVLQNEKVLQQNEEFKNLLGVQLKVKPLLSKIIILRILIPAF